MIKHDLTGLPKNNFWYETKGEKSALVFVHGIFSESRTCWISSNKTGAIFWPDLVLADSRLASMPIFMGGYHTAISSARAEIRDVAEELFRGLTLPDKFGNEPPLSRPELIFVCHSTGGIVVRYLLLNKRESFAAKKIGLILIASPSGGSKWANWFPVRSLARLYGNRLFQQLEWDNWSLRNLDYEFKNLRNEKMIPNLLGAEACEEHFIISHRFLPNLSFIVNPESACRYFGAPNNLPGTDHSTAVKPTDSDEEPHRFLLATVMKFWSEWSTVESPQPKLDLRSSDGSNALFYGSRRSTVVGRAAPRAELEVWLGDKKKFSWWVLLGPGGSGKSRLALECALAFKPGLAGFLSASGMHFDWHQWQPSKDTFIIVDYASGNLSDTKRMIDAISDRTDSLRSRVRILLIDRTVSGSLQDSWLRKVVGEGASKEKSKGFLFREEPITLEPLGDNELWRVFCEAVTARGSEIPDRSEFLPKLIALDSKRRPLFALFAADAFAHNRGLQNWDAHELLDLQLKNQRASWEPLGFDARYQNALVYATIMQQLDLGELYKSGLNEYLPPMADFDVELYRTVVPESRPIFEEHGKIGLGPLEPDILGEFVALESLLPDRFPFKTERFAIAMWNGQLQTLGTIFVMRAIEDFPDHPTLRALVQPRDAHRNYAWSAGCNFYVRSLAKRGKLNEAIDLYRTARDVMRPTESGSVVDRLGFIFNIETAQSLCLECLDAGNIGDASLLYEEVRAAASAKPQLILVPEYKSICVKSIVHWYSNANREREAYSILEEHLTWISQNHRAESLNTPRNAQHLIEAINSFISGAVVEQSDFYATSVNLLSAGVFFGDRTLINISHSFSVLLMPEVLSWDQLALQIAFFRTVVKSRNELGPASVGSVLVEIAHFDGICQRVMRLLHLETGDTYATNVVVALNSLSREVAQRFNQVTEETDKVSEFTLGAGLMLYNQMTTLNSILGEPESALEDFSRMIDFYSKLANYHSDPKVFFEGGLAPRERVKDAMVSLAWVAIMGKAPNISDAVERMGAICAEPSVKFSLIRHGYFDVAVHQLKDMLIQNDQRELAESIVKSYLDFLKDSGRAEELAQRKGKSAAEMTASLVHFFQEPLGTASS